jgi:hypothetical protein
VRRAAGNFIHVASSMMLTKAWSSSKRLPRIRRGAQRTPQASEVTDCRASPSEFDYEFCANSNNACNMQTKPRHRG